MTPTTTALAVALAALLPLASCATATAQQPGPAEPPTVAPEDTTTETSLVTISGQVFRRAVWCRGAAPTAHDEEILRQLHPTSRTLLIRPGAENTGQAIQAEVSAQGPEGRFEVQLPPGQWCIVEEAKRDPNTSGPNSPYHDSECVLRFQQQCDGVVTVEPDTPISDLQLIYMDSCQTRHPCYRGPMPP